MAGNEGASTTAVVSYASKFDPTFVWSSAKETGSSTPGSPSGSTNTGGSSTPVGAVVGGVVGGIAAITILASVLFYLKRKHDRQSALRDDGYSVYSGRSAYTGEKRGSANPRYGGGTGGHPGSVLGVPASEPPPGTYWGQDESGNTILLALPGQGMDHHGQGMESLAHGQGMEMGEMGSNGGFSEAGLAHGMPRQTAAMGTLPEPVCGHRLPTPHSHILTEFLLT